MLRLYLSLTLYHSLSFTLLHMNSIGVGKTTSFPGVGVVIGVGVGVMQQKTQQHHHQLAWHPAKPLTWARPSDPYASRPSTSWALLPVKSTVLGHVIGFLGCRLLSFSPRHHVFLSPMALFCGLIVDEHHNFINSLVSNPIYNRIMHPESFNIS
uniref:HDC12794 n=1 Tax=Drosophila melanogaster TaxID=7227 RepID=Q6IKD2_DROME|nr:TPA_inf: HDC12794 [Drosophila melanogaster]